MKPTLAGIALLVLAWLGLWVSNTGVLVFSADSKIPMTRECHYFIGVSVLKRLEPLADRCPLVRSIGP
jgi:hypothetical protein